MGKDDNTDKKRKKKVEESDDDDDDDGDNDDKAKSKKADENDDDDEEDTKTSKKKKPKLAVETNDQGETFWPLGEEGKGAPKRCTVRSWKNNIYVDFREFYEKGGKHLPGKKGISLNVDHYKTLRQIVLDGSLDQVITDLGGDVS